MPKSVRQKTILLVVLLCTAATATAADAVENKPWSGSVAFGYLSSTGNTDDTSVNVDFAVAYSAKPWTHAAKGRAYGASKDSSTTAESYKLGWKSSYDFDARNYAFGAVDWNKDRFAGIVRQTFATLGYGRRILTGPRYVLNAEAGVGYAEQKPSVGTTSDGATASLGGDFTWNISDTASFDQTLYIFTASDNTFWESVSKLRASLVGNLGLSLSFTLKRNSDVPAGTDKQDTLTAVSLDYAF